VSDFVLDASYSLAWCFADRATPNTDATLKRLEARHDRAIVPWVWQLEVGNALGKAVTRTKVPLFRALDIWRELLLLPIRHAPPGDVAERLGLAVHHNLSIYDVCYLKAALDARLPLATNDGRLKAAAEANQLVTMAP
jgi:predicted nucleic acid-binding protein